MVEAVFLRDHHSGEKTRIDVGVIDFLADVLDTVGETKATILSAYCTAETNAMLARTTFGVAEHSQHIVGRALDIRLGCDDAVALLRPGYMREEGGPRVRSNRNASQLVYLAATRFCASGLVHSSSVFL